MGKTVQHFRDGVCMLVTAMIGRECSIWLSSRRINVFVREILVYWMGHREKAFRAYARTYVRTWRYMQPYMPSRAPRKLFQKYQAQDDVGAAHRTSALHLAQVDQSFGKCESTPCLSRIDKRPGIFEDWCLSWLLIACRQSTIIIIENNMCIMQLFVGLELIGATRKDWKRQGFDGIANKLIENKVFTQKWVCDYFCYCRLWWFTVHTYRKKSLPVVISMHMCILGPKCQRIPCWCPRWCKSRLDPPFSQWLKQQARIPLLEFQIWLTGQH